MTLMHFACIQKGQCSKNILRLIRNETEKLILLPIECPIYPINASFAITISDFQQKYVYLVQLIQTTNTNLEFLQQNFCLFTFFYKVGVFNLVSNYD
jgi:hypothetical protein